MTQGHVLIIGGGPAGLAAAISAAREGVRVTVLEASSRVGRKVLTSGNGRCNFSNAYVEPASYNQTDFVEPIISEYGFAAIDGFFRSLGLLTTTDEAGRAYPYSNVAASVLGALRLECAHLGVDERTEAEVVEVSGGRDEGFSVVLRDGIRLVGDSVIVATGGGRSLLTAFGHTSVRPHPVLAPLRTDARPIRGLSGIRVRCSASLFDTDDDACKRPLATERGELLFRDYGVSGIMVFDLSRAITKRCYLAIDFFPDLGDDELLVLLQERVAALSWRSAEALMNGMLHAKVGSAVLHMAHIDPKTPAHRMDTGSLARALKRFRLDVTGIGDPKQAQVTRGGASVSEFDPRSLESQRVAGLFAAGEVLDVDGRCGGFNLHWAWASGIVAGRAAAANLTKGT